MRHLAARFCRRRSGDRRRARGRREKKERPSSGRCCINGRVANPPGCSVPAAAAADRHDGNADSQLV